MNICAIVYRIDTSLKNKRYEAMKTGSKHNIKRTMRDLIKENGTDHYDGNLTLLAEDTAERLGQTEWLDDADHVI